MKFSVHQNVKSIAISVRPEKAPFSLRHGMPASAALILSTGTPLRRSGMEGSPAKTPLSCRACKSSVAIVDSDV